jgi:hypothetical protein
VKPLEQTERQAFKAYIDKAYGYDVPEAEVEAHRERCIALIKQLMEIDIDPHQMRKIREVLALRNKDPKVILESRVEIPGNVDDPLSGKETILMVNRFGERLLTREAAKPLSKELQANIKNHVHTKLNFKGVKSTDNGFIDEAIAKVLFMAGEDHFNSRVRIVNANKQVSETLDYVISERKQFYIDIGPKYPEALRYR